MCVSLDNNAIVQLAPTRQKTRVPNILTVQIVVKRFKLTHTHQRYLTISDGNTDAPH